MSDKFPINHFFSTKNLNNNKHLDKGKAKLNISNIFDTNFVEDNQSVKYSSQSISQSQESELTSLNNEILELLEKSIESTKFKAYIENNLQLKSLDNNLIIFTVNTNFIKKLVDNFYLSTIKQAVFETLGNSYEIRVEVKNFKSTNEEYNSKASIIENIEIKPSNKVSFKLNQVAKDHVRNDLTKDNHLKKQSISYGNRIDDKKTFESFVVGPSNNMAYAFSLSVAKNPGAVYPQLYIYGNSGLGKTHLLNAICNYIKVNDPSKRICLITADDFLKEMVFAIQSSKNGEDKVYQFRRKYTEFIDVLIIDDIHELQNKTRTQAEFFQIFNQLQSQGKQLIFTSDKQPSEINGLEERITSRLNSAILVDIQQPDIETRIAILRKKAEEKDIFLDHDVINLIASSVKSNVRELEGKLVKLGAYSDIMNVEIDLEIAKKQLNISEEINSKKITLETIANSVANYYKITHGDLIGKTRKKEIVIARHIAMYMIHKILKITLEEIGNYFSKRDHSTVIYGIKRVEDLSKNDTQISRQIYEIESSL